MKIISTLILLFTFFQLNAQSYEADKLKIALKNLQMNNNLSNQNTFFELFPNSFESFLDAFGFKDGKESPIYFDGFECVESFFKLDSIQEERQIDKWINISINGQWEADVVGFFQENLRERVCKNIYLTYGLLKKRTNKEIISFFYFFFFEIHPQHESIPTYFDKLKLRDKKFYRLIQIGHKRALQDSGH